jgi:hypothetical protein
VRIKIWKRTEEKMAYKEAKPKKGNKHSGGEYLILDF